MPTDGHTVFGGAFDPDLGMPSTAYNGEFIFDTDDLNAENAGLFGLDAGDSAALHTFDSNTLGESKNLFATPGRPEQDLDFSPPSHRDSSSSGSSRRSADSNSPKTSHTSGDVMMTEDATFAEWKPFDALTNGHDTNIDLLSGHALDQSVDPSTHFDDSNFFDFASASSSPSEPPINGNVSLSPEDHSAVSAKSPSLQRKGHGKAQSVSTLHLTSLATLTHTQQYAFTNGISGVKAVGSREASPMFPSHESSPAGMFKDSPVSENNMNISVDSFQFRLPGPNSGWPAQVPFSARHGRGMQQGGLTASAPGVAYNGLAFEGKATLRIQPTPLKSRVETQIPIKLTFHNLPSTIKRLHLPRHSISKAKLLHKGPLKSSPDMLELYTMLVCTSAMQDEKKRCKAFEQAAKASRPTSPNPGPEADEIKPQNGGEVRICHGCITRERKRAGRKKNKKPEEDELWDKYQNYRAIVFNTQEVKEWQVATDTGIGTTPPPGTMQVDAPMRIACYCRHHQEKMGFQVIFTLKDYQNNVIVQEMSNAIMITDDHKTHLPPTATTITSSTAETQADAMPQDAPLPFRQTQSSSDLQSLQRGPALQTSVPKQHNSRTTSATATPRNLSRQASPTSPAGPAAKRRKPSSTNKLPQGLAMTRLETVQPPGAPLNNTQNDASMGTSATSPFSPAVNNFPMTAGPMFQPQPPSMNGMQQSFATGPLTPNSNNNELYPGGNSRNMSIDNMSLAQPMYSAPASAHPSRAPSPNHLRNEMSVLQQQTPLSQAIFNNTPVGMNSIRSPSPTIHKIIPGEGPKDGGIEVTVLGSGFTNGGLEVMFGDKRALTTTFWGESSLVCLLPPSHVAGNVLVRIRHPQLADQQPAYGGKQAIFRYIDDSEEQLMRTALILQRASSTRGQALAAGDCPPSAGNQVSGGYNFREAQRECVESGLMKILDLIDLDDSVNKARINIRKSTTGQTMLHLGCSLGMSRFVAGLLSRGANIHSRDKGGFTPLHFAAMNNHATIVRRLMIFGADPTMRSLSGLTAADLCQRAEGSREVLRALRSVERNARSHSRGSLHSRVNSATSLSSLWGSREPLEMSAYHDESLTDASGSGDSSDDDYEDSSGEFDSHMPNNHRLPEIVPSPPAGVPAGMASPGAAMTALQGRVLQQWQAVMHNWQQFQMPQMPQLPGRNDYHNMLNNAHFMQRFVSLVPNIGGSRPGSAGDHGPRDGDKQWWEITSLFGAKDSPPPAYEELFPHNQQSVDTKQASAAAAAAEYEADAKCAALYDQTEESTAESSKTRQVPHLLQIGRKNAITKEQQEDLQRAHAERLKTGSSDKMLWFVWLPLLIFILGMMIFNGAPAVIQGMTKFGQLVVDMTTTPQQTLEQLNNRAAVEAV
ncbi:E set [Apiospora phragmitis]|uniref:E set n=1 Tax=Apiospora phragmitis TaxID=2905665 RepID=A0ABR1WUT3_9PEZI